TTTVPTTAAAVAPAAATASTVAPAAAATTVAAAAAATRAFFPRTSFVHGERPAAQLGSVHGCDSLVRPVSHFDECEPARAAGFAIHHHLRARHLAVLAKDFTQLVFRCLERQVPDVQFLAHILPAGPCGPLRDPRTECRVKERCGRSSSR